MVVAIVVAVAIDARFCRSPFAGAVIAVRVAGCRLPSAVYRPPALHPGVRGNSNIEYVTTHPFANSGAPFELGGTGGSEEKDLRISEETPPPPPPTSCHPLNCAVGTL